MIRVHIEKMIQRSEETKRVAQKNGYRQLRAEYIYSTLPSLPALEWIIQSNASYTIQTVFARQPIQELINVQIVIFVETRVVSRKPPIAKHSKL